MACNMNNNMNCNMNRNTTHNANCNMNRNANYNMGKTFGNPGCGMNRNMNNNGRAMVRNTVNAKPSNTCGCMHKEGCDRGTEPVDQMVPAMCYVPWQKWEDIYCKEEALEKGTIFAQLDKPFLGRPIK